MASQQIKELMNVIIWHHAFRPLPFGSFILKVVLVRKESFMMDRHSIKVLFFVEDTGQQGWIVGKDKILGILNSLRNASVRHTGEAALDHADILFIIQ